MTDELFSNQPIDSRINETSEVVNLEIAMEAGNAPLEPDMNNNKKMTKASETHGLNTVQMSPLDSHDQIVVTNIITNRASLNQDEDGELEEGMDGMDAVSNNKDMR